MSDQKRPIRVAKAALTAADTGTGKLIFYPGLFSMSISGTFVATVSLQRLFEGESTWLDVEDFTGPVERNGETAEGSQYRLFIKTGNFTSGTADVRLSQ